MRGTEGVRAEIFFSKLGKNDNRKAHPGYGTIVMVSAVYISFALKETFHFKRLNF